MLQRTNQEGHGMSEMAMRCVRFESEREHGWAVWPLDEHRRPVRVDDPIAQMDGAQAVLRSLGKGPMFLVADHVEHGRVLSFGTEMFQSIRLAEVSRVQLALRLLVFLADIDGDVGDAVKQVRDRFGVALLVDADDETQLEVGDGRVS